MKRWLSGLLRLLRLHNAAAAALAVYVGFSMAHPGGVPLLLILAVVTSTVSGNVINDYFDVDIDAVNRPERPIPSGTITGAQAVAIYLLFVVLTAIAMVGLERLTTVLWLTAWLFFLFVYSFDLKRRPLIGNLVVSMISASGFLLGAYAGGEIRRGILPASFTFLFVLAREIVKDVDDMPGDGSCGARTLPLILGEKKSLKISFLIFAVLMLSFPLPFLLHLYGMGYGIVMLLTVIPILLVSSVLTLKNERLKLVSTLLKIGMFSGSIAFYFG